MRIRGNAFAYGGTSCFQRSRSPTPIGGPATRCDLDKALGDITALDRPLVIEARIDPAQYMAQF